jgi:hypothetical protein
VVDDERHDEPRDEPRDVPRHPDEKSTTSRATSRGTRTCGVVEVEPVRPGESSRCAQQS